MIGGHEFERLASEEAGAAERAAEIEHVREPRVVIHGRKARRRPIQNAVRFASR